MTARKTASLLAGAALAVLTLLPPGGVRADEVKVFDKPPTLEELRKALGTAKGGQPATTTRSIQIDDDGAAPPAPAPAAAAAPAAMAPAPTAMAPAAMAPAAAPARPRPKPAVAHAAPATAQVSEKAVAFRINFDYNSATIRPESSGFLDSIAQLLKAEPQSRLVIEGHTDAAGSYAYNLQLSKARAAAVRAALVDSYGIAASRLIAIGKGPSELLNTAEPTSPDNRRVQFRLRG